MQRVYKIRRPAGHYWAGGTSCSHCGRLINDAPEACEVVPFDLVEVTNA